MWIITKIGFFNVVCQDSDGTLTIKARSREDLERLNSYVPYTSDDIEESDTADYRFRVKAKKNGVRSGLARLVDEIDYPKTKPKLSELHPERGGIYLNVWEDLGAIQWEKEKENT